jgi:hypothetical protein
MIGFDDPAVPSRERGVNRVSNATAVSRVSIPERPAPSRLSARRSDTLPPVPEMPGRDADDWATVGAIGIAAYMIADVAHEAIGHGIACMAHGASISLLTSVYFRCSSRSPLVAVAGPSANLAVAWLVSIAQRRSRTADARLRLLLLTSLAFNLFWGAGSMVYHSISNRDDWAIAVAGNEPLWLWRIGLVVLGCMLYYLGIRSVIRTLSVFVAADEARAPGRAQRLVLVPYAVAGAAACMAAALYVPGPLGAIREGALETYAASIGVLVPVLRGTVPASTQAPLPRIPRSGNWIAAVTGAFILFAVLLGHGIG